MNRTLVLATALATGLVSSSLFAQVAAKPPAAPAPAHATPAAPAEVTPEAVPAKIAVIAFEQAVVATNEGQRAVAAVQKKYEPQKTSIDARSAEVDSLKKQYQALPASLSDEERATRLKDIDTKEKALQRDVEDATNSYNSDVQEAYGKVAQKFGGTAVKYAQDHGFTLLLNVSPNQQQLPTLLWWQQATDITEAVIKAYNVASGVPPPPPSAPTPHPPSAPTPNRTPAPATHPQQ